MINYKEAQMIDIDKRTFDFSVEIIKLVNLLPKTTAGYAIGNQIVRSGTSIGANVQEALGGHTKTDFTYCMNIAKKEARETRYWLKLILSSGLMTEAKLNLLIKESEEIVAILTTIVKNSHIKKNS